ncbi:MAG: hypothetical protein P8J37_20000 [Fuerstiella sp.]|jgi:hypothetical protein|nr:hypothetical protein [Fuerstiella sp.]
MEFGKRTTALMFALTMPVVCVVCIGCSDAGGDGYVQYGQIQSDPPSTPVGSVAADNKPAVASASEPQASSASDKDTDPNAEVVATEDVATDQTPSPVVKTVSKTEDDPAAESTTPSGDNLPDKTDQSAAAVNVPGAEVPAAEIETIGPDSADAENPQSAEPREIKLLISEKRLLPEGDSKALRLTYDDIDLLKILNMEPVPHDADKHFPEWLNDLSGKRIRIRGFMYPTFEATGLTAFTMARDNGICCFVRQPKIYDIIGISLADGETTDYIEGKPFDVEGVFQIAPEADDTELYQLYRIADAKVLK